jgi:hypothetical protein
MTPEPNPPILDFVAGTPLLTPEGHKPIEQLRLGDMIQARPAGEVCGVFVTRQPIFLLHLNGQVIRTTADHPFFVTGQGWTDASELQVGDSLRTHAGQDVTIEASTDNGEQEVVYQMPAAVPRIVRNGLWAAGTLIETEDGPKPIEDIQPSDRIPARDPLNPGENGGTRPK